jgi:hypothetical protein
MFLLYILSKIETAAIVFIPFIAILSNIMIISQTIIMIRFVKYHIAQLYRGSGFETLPRKL